MKRTPVLACVLALTALALGCASGSDDESTGVAGARTVRIQMVDIAFRPDSVDVATGETVRFLFENAGKVDHDAVIGDSAEQLEHEQEMRAVEREGHGDEHGAEPEGAITVEPGKSGELTRTFERAETTEIGCHELGHYDAGMKVTVEVA